MQEKGYQHLPISAQHQAREIPSRDSRMLCQKTGREMGQTEIKVTFCSYVGSRVIQWHQSDIILKRE